MTNPNPLQVTGTAAGVVVFSIGLILALIVFPWSQCRRKVLSCLTRPPEQPVPTHPRRRQRSSSFNRQHALRRAHSDRYPSRIPYPPCDLIPSLPRYEDCASGYVPPPPFSSPTDSSVPPYPLDSQQANQVVNSENVSYSSLPPPYTSMIANPSDENRQEQVRVNAEGEQREYEAHSEQHQSRQSQQETNNDRPALNETR